MNDDRYHNAVRQPPVCVCGERMPDRPARTCPNPPFHCIGPWLAPCGCDAKKIRAGRCARFGADGSESTAPGVCNGL